MGSEHSHGEGHPGCYGDVGPAACGVGGERDWLLWRRRGLQSNKECLSDAEPEAWGKESVWIPFFLLPICALASQLQSC